MRFELGTPAAGAESTPPPPEYIARQRDTRVLALPGIEAEPPHAVRAEFPLALFAEQAAGMGHLNMAADSDVRVRSLPLAVEYGGQYYPSLVLLLAARALAEKPADMVLVLGEGVRLGDRLLPTDTGMRLRHGFYAVGEHDLPFATYRFHEVLSGQVPPAVFGGKLVSIGLAPDTGPQEEAASSSRTPSVTPAALALAAVLGRDFYTRPPWAPWAEAAALGLALVYLTLALPRMRGRSAAVTSLVLSTACLAGGLYLLASERLWLKSAAPALLIAVGHGSIGLERLVQDSRRHLAEEREAAQTNRLLGLPESGAARHGHGQIPPSARGRVGAGADLQPRAGLRAQAPVQQGRGGIRLHLEPSRQVPRRGRAQAARPAGRDESAARPAPHPRGGTLILDGGENPTLGRYELLEEIGKGAMGVVYLGRDPTLNRLVAIETLALSQEFESQELAEVKARFFREAEAAGRLHHPHIVTIYDAGEEHDLAYIAMGYLPGKDLTYYLSQGKPLPLAWVSSVGMRVADALAYAHKNEVVHRDIKPANIVYNEDDDTLKITDFGIARITAARRTQSGVILGTPSYMSPEQLTGKPVDGRSDLFSLGVMLLELTTGQQPFNGDELAILVYQIANERHPDVLSLRPDAPPCLAKIINRALQKEPNRRYASGEDLRDDLEQCFKRLPERERQHRRVRT